MWPGGYTEFGDGENYARLNLERQLSPHTVMSGISNHRRIALGHTFNLHNYPREDQNQQYLLTSVHYEFEENARVSQGKAGKGLAALAKTSASAETAFGRLPERRCIGRGIPQVEQGAHPSLSLRVGPHPVAPARRPGQYTRPSNSNGGGGIHMNKRDIKNLFIKQCPHGDHPLKPGQDPAGALVCRTCGGHYRKVSDWNVTRLLLVFFGSYVVIAAVLGLLFKLFGSGAFGQHRDVAGSLAWPALTARW